MGPEGRVAASIPGGPAWTEREPTPFASPASDAPVLMEGGLPVTDLSGFGPGTSGVPRSTTGQDLPGGRVASGQRSSIGTGGMAGAGGAMPGAPGGSSPAASDGSAGQSSLRRLSAEDGGRTSLAPDPDSAPSGNPPAGVPGIPGGPAGNPGGGPRGGGPPSGGNQPAGNPIVGGLPGGDSFPEFEDPFVADPQAGDPLGFNPQKFFDAPDPSPGGPSAFTQNSVGPQESLVEPQGTPEAATVPEPAALVLMGAGLAFAARRIRRRSKARTSVSS